MRRTKGEALVSARIISFILDENYDRGGCMEMARKIGKQTVKDLISRAPRSPSG
jgi:hypothetical protein